MPSQAHRLHAFLMARFPPRPDTMVRPWRGHAELRDERAQGFRHEGINLEGEAAFLDLTTGEAYPLGEGEVFTVHGPFVVYAGSGMVLTTPTAEAKPLLIERADDLTPDPVDPRRPAAAE